MKVGYVGLGAMGRALAAHLPKACDLHVFDRSIAAIDALAAVGAQPADSLAEMAANADCVFLCLPRSADVEQVLLSPGGLADSLPSGAIVIDQTSGIPSETRRFAAALQDRGIAMLDAPVAGGVPAAIGGTITIMASGDPAAYATALPLMQAISPKVSRCSDRLGDAQALKSVNNIINAAYRVGTLEIVAVGRALGLSIATMAGALDGGSGRNFMTAKLLPAIAEGRSSTDFALSLMVKDLDQAIALGMAVGAATPASGVARDLIRIALNMLGPDARLDDMVPFMERVTGQSFTADARALSDAETRSALDLIETAMAASNRFIVLENAAAAARMRLDLAAIEPILASGSAYSHAAAAAFAATRGEPFTAPPLADTIDALTRLADAGARHGVALMMTNTIRTGYLQAARRGGTGIEALASNDRIADR